MHASGNKMVVSDDTACSTTHARGSSLLLLRASLPNMLLRSVENARKGRSPPRHVLSSPKFEKKGKGCVSQQSVEPKQLSCRPGTRTTALPLAPEAPARSIGTVAPNVLPHWRPLWNLPAFCVLGLDGGLRRPWIGGSLLLPLPCLCRWTKSTFTSTRHNTER
jgi:hypothetical protein